MTTLPTLSTEGEVDTGQAHDAQQTLTAATLRWFRAS
ncbi:hypothetical protein EV192_104321 [Actinocrispum wychmicini]|uniref:Uncharacterized protein n=1 Tax=Actinocrispum wychmicini TaxID=1213861 RepID=A0A4R2JRK5_9PSEU|nr:hypothetical protein EV192_104321 [Actinocrispum wychmicini]